jgi:hypothetical protein
MTSGASTTNKAVKAMKLESAAKSSIDFSYSDGIFISDI